MNSCVACQSQLSGPIAFFGKQLPSAIYNRTQKDMDFLQETSLDLAICSNEACRLVQLITPVDLTYVYENYPYKTATTATMSSNLHEFALSSLSRIELNDGDVILDIGGNDGTLLSIFAEAPYKLINIDAASDIEQCFESPNYIHISSYFSREAYKNVTSVSPRVIFSSAMFYQLIDLGQFCKDLNSIMSTETVFFMQMTYLDSMYRKNIFDNVVHEHVTYFSLYSLEHLLSLHGLRVFDASIQNLYGGTLRVGIVKVESQMNENSYNLHKIRLMEQQNATNSTSTLREFGENFEKWKLTARKFLDLYLEDGKTLIGFGASTKGNMLMQALGMTASQISFIIDNNDRKIGTWTTKTLIPIVSEKNIEKIQQTVLLLPYYYLDAMTDVIKRYVPEDEFVEILTLLPEPASTLVRGTQAANL